MTQTGVVMQVLYLCKTEVECSMLKSLGLREGSLFCLYPYREPRHYICSVPFRLVLFFYFQLKELEVFLWLVVGLDH